MPLRNLKEWSTRTRSVGEKEKGRRDKRWRNGKGRRDSRERKKGNKRKEKRERTGK